MTWIFYALLAPMIYSVVNYIDKYIVEKKVKDYSGLPVFGSIAGFTIGTLFWIYFKFPVLAPADAGFLILSGMFTIWGAAFYFKALSTEETSKIILFFQAVPLFVLGLSYVFLNESLTVTQLLGFFIILSVTMAASVEKSKKKFVLNRSILYILAFDLLWAISAIIVKLAVNANSFSKILSYESWGIGIGGLLMYIFIPNVRNAFHHTFSKVGSKVLTIMFVNEVIFVFAKSVTFYAYSIGPTAAVSVLGGTQVFIGVLYGWLLTIIAPRIFKEDIRKKTLIKKAVLACIVLFGIYLVA